MNPALRAAMPLQAHHEPPPPAAGSPLGVGGGFDVPLTTGAVARGDTRAFEVLYRAWFGRVFGYARGLTGRDESFCLDVAQEVMLRAARGLPRLSTEAALGAWFSRACLSAAVDLLRREQRARRREARIAGRGVPAESRQPEDLAGVARAIQSLADIDHVLLMQRVVHGVSLREAAAAVGIGEQAAHGRVRRAIARLRQLAEAWR